MRRQIVGSVRSGEATVRIAERLLDIDSPIVRLPKHVVELERAARMSLASGDRNVYIRAAKKWERTIERLGATSPELSIRSATKQLVTDLKKAKVGQIDGIVDRWTLERARFQARVIARSEVVAGYRDQAQRQAADKDYTVGFRWTLSTRHPEPDVCDSLASQDLDGLGPGGYLPGNVPPIPHPSDLCNISPIVDEQHFARERAKLKGTREPSKPWLSGKTQTGEQWLKGKPESFQKRLLGPTRFEAFQRGKTVLDAGGVPIPVHKVLGIPKQKRTLGPAVVVGPIIKRDRASMVRPFPKVSPSRS